MDSKMNQMDSAFMGHLEEYVLTSFRSAMEKMASVWKELGICEELQCDRSMKAIKLIANNIRKMALSEVALYKETVTRVDEYVKELNELTICLGIEPTKLDDSWTLLEKERRLRVFVDELVQLKQERLKHLKELKNMEQKLCKVLNWPPHEISSKTGVPNTTDLRELEENIKMLKEEMERRRKKFWSTKREILAIMEETELSPETFFEREVICYEEEQFSLSNQNLKELEDFLQKVKNKKLHLEKQRKDSLEKLSKLWDRLNISNDEKQNFLASHKDFRTSTLQSIQLEIDRCEEIKRQNIKSYIETLQDELMGLWKSCYIPESQQKEFLALYENESSDEALAAYESEVQKMTKYRNDVEDILQKIYQRQELWDQMIVFENYSCDPNRFVNRGGRLLQEEKQRKKIQKDLPKLESDLFKAIEDYNEYSGKLFLYNGVSFQDFVHDQWAQRLNDKENEKVLRQLKRNLVTKHEATMGTPASKKRSLSVPKSAPSKMMKSNIGASIFYTPAGTSKMKPDVGTSNFNTPNDHHKMPSSANVRSLFCTPRVSRQTVKANAGSPFLCTPRRSRQVTKATTNGQVPNSETSSAVATNPGGKNQPMKSHPGTPVFRTPASVRTESKTTDATSRSAKRAKVTPRGSSPQFSSAKRNIGGVFSSEPNKLEVEERNTQDARGRSAKCAKVTPRGTSPRFSGARRNIGILLMEHNKPEESTRSPNSTTYSDFANELNKPSRSGLRSSVLESKKFFKNQVLSARGGTRAGLPLRNMSKVEQKLAFARGKPGLPFLI